MMQTPCTQAYTPQQLTPSASAVNIQIFQPQAYGSQPQQSVQAPIYQYPAQSVYSQPCANQYQQYIPQQQVYQPVPQYQPVQPQQAYQPVQETQPQAMPAPVLTETQQPAVQQAVDSQAASQQAPEINIVEPQQQSQSGIDVDALVNGLRNTDNSAQETAITEIAKLSQGDPSQQSAILSEPVMTGLADIIKQDTSALQGPTDAQIAALNKAASGQQLTPEEEALTQQLAPKTAADKNRVISMFTLSMLQKNQRDEIDRYNQSQDANNQLPQMKISDLIGFNELQNAAVNEQEKEVKLAAIQALSYAARPEDKEILEPIMQNAMQDPEPLIQQAASDALANIGSKPVQAQETKVQEPVDVSKMSRKEKRAYQKAQKQAEKEAKKTA